VVRLTGLAAAIQFLTRVPIRLRRAPDVARSLVWFPVVGGLIGAAVGGIAAGLWHTTTPLVAAAVAVIAGVLVTGAFHEDGLADVADAFAGGTTIERRLEILKDSRHGSYGVAALCSSIVLRVVALASFSGPLRMFTAAVAAHAVGRGAAVGLMGVAPPVNHTGLGRDYGQVTTRTRAGLALVVGVAIAAVAVQWHAAALIAVAVFSIVTVRWLALRKIGGISGDVLGTCEQVAECVALVVLSALSFRR
jgi:adenosylcobinamide-GDP ribazoletransferase